MNGRGVCLVWLILWPVLLPVYVMLLLFVFLANGWMVFKQTMWPDSLG